MMQLNRSGVVLCAAWCVVAGTSRGLSQPSEPTRPAATQLEFYLVGADGGPIVNLRPDEITLQVDGRRRAVRALRWVPTVPQPAPALPLTAPYGTNELTQGGRSIILVVDEDSFRPGRESVLREAADRFLIELAAADRVSLVTVPYGGVKVDFTTNHTALGQALGRIVGQAPADQTGSDFACRTRRTLEALVGLFESLAGGRGPTAVLFISSGLAAPRRDAALALGPGMCELTTDQFEQVGAAAAIARAHLYLIQTEDTVAVRGGTPRVETIAGGGFNGSDNPLAGLEHLAGVTGGTRLQLLTARESSLARVARETSGHYLLEFVPDAADRNGRRHAVDLEVARPDATLRARPTVVIAKAAPAPARSPAPRDMLRQPRVFRDLPLRTGGYASRGQPGELKVLAIVEPAEPGVRLRSAAAGLFDAKGQLRAQWTASAEELERPQLLTALVVPPGQYRLRVAAVDAQGRGGTADDEVSAALTPAGPLSISGLVLGLSRSGGFRPALAFASEPVATGYLEIYGATDSPPTVTMEIATSENGPALLTVPAAVASTSESDRRIATGALPIGALPPGDFLVRAVVGVAGQPAGRVTRTLRKGASLPH